MTDQNRPSAHLTWDELACNDGTPYPVEWRETRLPALVELFEAIRARVGGPVAIGCGYRTPTHNRKVGGAAKSQHVDGRALDLHTPPGWSLKRFHDLGRSMGSVAPKLGGIGYYRWGLHVDTRMRPWPTRVTAWSGRNVKLRA